MQKTTLDLEKTVALAKTYYCGKQSIGAQNLEEHCRRVARLGRTIAEKLFADIKNDSFSSDAQTHVAAVAHAGVLHAAIDAGACMFEDIAEHTTVQIADIVAVISRDFRLIETKRDIEFRGRICQSPLAAQIVALADVIVTAKEVFAEISERGLASVRRPRKILIRLDGDLLALHGVSRYYVLRLYAHAAKNLLVQTSQLIKDQKKQARTEKVQAASIAAIKRNIAAKQGVVEKATTVSQRKRKQNGQ